MKKNKLYNRITDGMLHVLSGLIAIVLIMLTGLAFCQSPLQNKAMQVVLKPTSQNDWLEFRDESSVNPLTVFTDYKTPLGLSANDEMQLVRSENDQIGMTHYRYQQYYKGVKVLGAEYIVHAKDGRVVSANGNMVPGIDQPSLAAINENEAINMSLKFVKSQKYSWLNADAEARIRKFKKDNSATYFPKGELVYATRRDVHAMSPSNLILCWKFDINVEDGLSATIILDATTGELINSIPLDLNCSSGTATTIFNGTQTVWTKSNGGHYDLYNDCNSVEFHVRNANAATDLSNVTEYSDGDNNWAATSQASAVQVMFGIRKAYYYYLTTHLRDSYDGSGSDIDCYNNAWFTYADGTSNNSNAQWSNNGHYLRFGLGASAANSDDWNSDDIVGHEFTHGVTQYSANLTYQSESGALNESFSDIFGEMVENYIEGSMDWLEGADRGAIRSFSNPNTYNQPDTYNGTNWYSGTNDFGGVHTNSGVQNYFFYLLSVGGSGTNDNGKSFNVTGIGAPAAAAIGYRALTVYLNSGSQYIDSRAAWIHAAIDLYGTCSNQAIQVGNAWHAVGVESQSSQWSAAVCGVWPQLSSVTFQAINTVTGGNGCANIIAASSFSVTYSSDDKVILYPGFDALVGSHFVAYVEPCAITRYRLVSPDGADESPEEISAEQSNFGLDEMNSVVAVPNPFNDEINVMYKAGEGERAIITIHDLLGKIVMQQTENISIQGVNKLKLETSQLEHGSYFIDVQTPSMKQTVKVIKAN